MSKKFHTNLNPSDMMSIHKNILSYIISDNLLYDNYIYLSKNYIDKYNKIINTPVKTSFIKTEKRINTQDDINELTNEYINFISKMFSNDDTVNNIIKKYCKSTQNNIACECGNTTEFIYRFNTYRICENCGLETDYVVCTVENSTYSDLQQINLNQRYKYEKICHFKDTVNQFQAKQNKHIPPKVYKDLEDMIQKHDLIIKTGKNRKEQYTKITKHHIRDFLYETSNNKYYEDIQLLWCKLTDNTPPNITDLEKNLYDDFERLVDAFLSLPNTNRKNFLNSQYVLKQLLRRYNYNVKDSDLNMLKTPARLREHDELYERCCDLLNWNFYPL